MWGSKGWAMMLVVENEKYIVKEIKHQRIYGIYWFIVGVSKPFLLKGQKVSILGFGGHMIFVANTQLCGSMKAATGDK